MPIRALFATGQTEITVNGLHQWDYGQTLEIYSGEYNVDIPTIIKVHFACVGMDEAVVRVAETLTGKATVTIPDRCLEQTTPITAWVFEIDGSTGTTTKKITLPIEPRTRPSPVDNIPAEVEDEIAELITAVNEAVDMLKDGSVVVAKAKEAGKADSATKAGKADSATIATYASEDTSKGTIEDRLTACADKDEVDYANSAGTAVNAVYASNDISKGTIESRLTACEEHDKADTAEAIIIRQYRNLTMWSGTNAGKYSTKNRYMIPVTDPSGKEATDIIAISGAFRVRDLHYDFTTTVNFEAMFTQDTTSGRALEKCFSHLFGYEEGVTHTDISPETLLLVAEKDANYLYVELYYFSNDFPQFKEIITVPRLTVIYK